MNETHTPGPWTYSEGDGEIFSATSRLVAQLSEGGSADGCLIAAAPELLAALKVFQARMDDAEGSDVMREEVDRAIAKAEGR